MLHTIPLFIHIGRKFFLVNQIARFSIKNCENVLGNHVIGIISDECQLNEYISKLRQMKKKHRDATAVSCIIDYEGSCRIMIFCLKFMTRSNLRKTASPLSIKSDRFFFIPRKRSVDEDSKVSEVHRRIRILKNDHVKIESLLRRF